MKKPTIILLSTVIVCGLLILGCSNPFSTEEDAPDITTNEKGTIEIEMPSVAPYAERDTKDDELVEAKAYLTADTVDLTLYDSSGSIVEVTTISSSSTSGWEVPTGTGYYIYAQVYNSAVSTSSPVVAGYSSSFDITSGATTTVTITCTPYNTTTLYADTSSSGWLLDQDGEKWFEISASSTETYEFSVTSSGNSDTGIYVYDSSGNYIDSTDSTTTTDTVAISVNSGSTYYIGIREYGVTSSGDTFSVLVSSDATDWEEENDTMSTACVISEQTEYSANIEDGDPDWYEIYVNNDWLDFQLNFSDANGDIDLVLYDSSGTELASSTSTSDNERIVYQISTYDTYYIEVFSFDGSANSYTMWWDDVASDPTSSTTGLLNVNIQ